MLQAYGLSTFGFFIFSLFFLNPTLICEKNGDPFECSFTEACLHKNFRIDFINSPKSLALEYELICEKEYI